MTDAEKRKLKEILGFGPEVVNNEGWRQVYYNSIWDLEGIIHHLGREEIDRNYIQRLKNLQQHLIAFDNYIK